MPRAFTGATSVVPSPATNSPGSRRDLVCPAERSRDAFKSKPSLSKKLDALPAMLRSGHRWQGAPTSGPGKATKDFWKRDKMRFFTLIIALKRSELLERSPSVPPQDGCWAGPPPCQPPNFSFSQLQ